MARPGVSIWAARFAALSTIALLLCFVLQDAWRSLAAFIWVCLALLAMGFQFAAKRRLQASQPRRGRRRR